MRSPLIERYATDWPHLCATSADQVRAWSTRRPALAGCTDLESVLEAIRRDPDPALHALLTEHRRGDALAGRVVLQTMLPKLVRMSRRDPQADLADHVAHLWPVIARYPLERRPLQIAANLALDTLKAVKAEQAQLVEPVGLCPAPSAVAPEHDEITARRVLRAARTMGLLDARSHALLVSVYADGLAGRDAAQRHRLTPIRVRQLSSQAVRRLRAHAVELAEVA